MSGRQFLNASVAQKKGTISSKKKQILIKVKTGVFWCFSGMFLQRIKIPKSTRLDPLYTLVKLRSLCVTYKSVSSFFLNQTSLVPSWRLKRKTRNLQHLAEHERKYPQTWSCLCHHSNNSHPFFFQTPSNC